MQRLRRGDLVQVTKGSDKPKRGKVLRIDLEDDLVVVQGINLVYKHIRRSQKYPQGGRVEKEAPIDISNVMVFDTDLDRPVRVRVGKVPAPISSSVNVAVMETNASPPESPAKPVPPLYAIWNSPMALATRIGSASSVLSVSGFTRSGSVTSN